MGFTQVALFTSCKEEEPELLRQQVYSLKTVSKRRNQSPSRIWGQLSHSWLRQTLPDQPGKGQRWIWYVKALQECKIGNLLPSSSVQTGMETLAFHVTYEPLTLH